MEIRKLCGKRKTFEMKTFVKSYFSYYKLRVLWVEMRVLVLGRISK